MLVKGVAGNEFGVDVMCLEARSEASDLQSRKALSGGSSLTCPVEKAAAMSTSSVTIEPDHCDSTGKIHATGTFTDALRNWIVGLSVADA